MPRFRNLKSSDISGTSLYTDSVSIGLVCWVSTDLFEGSLSSEEFVEKADGDAKHGGQSQTPPNDLAPPRVNVSVVVRQRLVVHQVEQEDALQRGRNRSEPTRSHPHLNSTETACWWGVRGSTQKTKWIFLTNNDY